MSTCTTSTLRRAMRRAGASITDQKVELNHLDREIGDGDHGENLTRGFAAVQIRLATSAPEYPGDILKLVAMTLISAVGGASGPLYGTAFLRAANAAGTRAELDGMAIADLLAAALDGVVDRGKAQPGDKTMVDALTPAVQAAQQAAADDGDVAAVLAAAAAAAEQGAQATDAMQARKGRASYLGTRSVGHRDPGACSTAYLLGSLASSARS